MDCGLPEVLDALNGRAPATDVRMVVPPAQLDGRARPTADGKAVYGASFAYHLETANFTLQWEDPDVDPDRARELADAMEAGWTALVEDAGWPAPVSSDAYLLWVILDPALGHSGFTTEYTSTDYPEGYPVVWLDPDLLPRTPAFGESAAVHELGHALQYRLRDWSGGAAEVWYWEATSEWMAERGAPWLDAYAGSSYWYAQAPGARYDALEGSHAYGMFLLNAYLDEHLVGFDGIRDAWMLSADRPGEDWADILAASTGVPMGEIVVEMAGALAAGALREASLYDAPARDERAFPELYGSRFLDLEGEPPVVEGEVRYAVDGAWGEDVPDGPYTMVITNVGEEESVEEETAPDGGATPAGCGCHTAATPGWFSLAAGLAALRSRARSRRADPAGACSPRAPS